MNGPTPNTDGKPLEEFTIGITRPESDSGALKELIHLAGGRSVLIPTFRIDPLDASVLSALIGGSGNFDWIVFTSSNSVTAVYRLLDRTRPFKVAAVGKATTQNLQGLGAVVDFVSPDGTADGLVEKFPDPEGARILLPKSNLSRLNLEQGLIRRGAEVHSFTAYENTPVEIDSGATKDLDALIFASPSAYRNLVAAAPIPESTQVVCIGPVTAAAVVESGRRVDRIAEEPSDSGLVQALIDLLST